MGIILNFPDMFKKKKKKNSYPWQFASVGGKVRVKIQSGKDIAHLGELDRKMWTVLSCPVTGLEFDEATLKAIDRDGDGKIRVDEVIATAQWLCSVLNDPEILLKEADSLPISELNSSEDGARLAASAVFMRIISVMSTCIPIMHICPALFINFTLVPCKLRTSPFAVRASSK